MVITYEELLQLKEKHPDKKLVFCSGTFDLFHAGHVIFLEYCKSLGDILIVALGPDEEIKKNKPNRPILDQDSRLRVIDAMRAVDYSFFSNLSESGAHWLSPIEEIFRYFKPDFWAIMDDGEIKKRQEIADRFGVSLVIFNRVFPLSTTSIINKIRDLK